MIIKVTTGRWLADKKDGEIVVTAYKRHAKKFTSFDEARAALRLVKTYLPFEGAVIMAR